MAVFAEKNARRKVANEKVALSLIPRDETKLRDLTRKDTAELNRTIVLKNFF